MQVSFQREAIRCRRGRLGLASGRAHRARTAGQSLCEIAIATARQRIDALRLTIDCLPISTRKAMLRGLRTNERIIVGAYVDDEGGVCPMLAAHRCGGRTDFLAFAKSWDRFTRAAGKSRAASGRELNILISHLEASLVAEDGLELDRAIREHMELRERGRQGRRRRVADAADPAGNIVARRVRSLRRRGALGDAQADAAARALLPT